MTKPQLQEILSGSFSQNNWIEVLKEIFQVKRLHREPQQISLPANDKADAAFELGSLDTSDDRIIGLYLVEVKPNVWLEENRVGLRNLLRNIYKYDVDGALVVFRQKNKWRLSFVSEIRVADGDQQLIDQITEPKRYTYFLGEGEKVKTPTDRIFSLRNKPLNLEDIRDAFSVEALNEEFYKIVARQFYKLVGATEGKGTKTITHERTLQLPNVSISDRKTYQEFAVRLIGRTVFCWFLKMKKPDHASNGGIPLLPEFLLSSEAVRKNKGYYHSILELLFFQTLNTPMDQRRTDLPKGTDTIPFLNGGLFEPQPDDFYKPDSQTGISKNLNTLIIPDDWFIEFFEKLEQFNFTIDENSVVDVEVSVDPEMLGRIFENLLAEIDPDSGETARKATGSFYTPREVVDYMASESLVQFLVNHLEFPDNKSQETLREELHGLFHLDYQFANDSAIWIHKVQILEALDKLKILDPACGSGAFPIGVMQKIVMALQKLDPQSTWWKARQIEKVDNAYIRQQIKSKLDQASVEYARKIGIIQNSLYGVDIQPVAAEISKLRCFLTLIVDETIDESKPNRGVEPLPNLEFKFVTADTLIGLPSEDGQQNMFSNYEELLKLKELRKDYLQSYGKEKEQIKAEFLNTQKSIFKQQLSFFDNPDSRAYKLSVWNPFSHDKCDWFDPDWMFGVEKFDLVIGNPPYVQLQKDNGALARKYSSQSYQTFERMGDIYSLFYERGHRLLRKDGILCYITSNKWMRAGYGESTRGFFANQTNPLLLVDFAGQKIFKSATVDTNILLFTKGSNIVETNACVVKEDAILNLGVYISKHKTKLKFNNSDSWVVLSPIEQRIKEKIERIGTPLKDWDIQINYGIKTGYNDAFIINGEKKNELIAMDPKSAEIIRPILRGRDIKRYGYNFSDLWLLFVPWHFPLHLDNSIKGASDIAEKEFKLQYPIVYEHLLNHKGRLENRNTAETGIRYEWYALQRWGANYWEDFFRPKIVWGEISDKAKFGFDETGKFVPEATTFLMTGKSLYYLFGFLNSSLSEFQFAQIGTTTGVGTVRWKKFTIEQLLIPRVSSTIEEEFERIIKELLVSENKSHHQEKLNKKIYDLFDLSVNEIEIIEQYGS